MKESEDVTKLFAMFGEKKADQYYEVYEADQNRATHDRWPVFQRIRFGSEQDGTAPEPFVSAPARSNAMAALAGVARRHSPADVERAPTAAPESRPAAPVPAPAEGGGNLHTLFKRLEGSAQEPVEAPAAAPVAQPEQSSGSIRSLFNRLSRP
ncbi:hypothetical protein [Pusillimonas sp.]|uniref:hypothetical protein n=1 Tax=Pusillimonas sp. TaxID=3040095 RepID=UPI0037C7354C